LNILKRNNMDKELEEAAERHYINCIPSDRHSFISGANWQAEQILEFLYSEITERRDYSASKMCEKVIEFIEQNKKKQDETR